MFHSLTDSDGRVGTLLDPSHQLVAGIYRMTFQTSEYWASVGVTAYFHPYVQVIQRFISSASMKEGLCRSIGTVY